MGCAGAKIPETTRIVIVGGGMAGHKLAKGLQSSGAHITIIEKRQTYNHNIANPRAAVDPRWMTHLFVPYDKSFTASNTTVVHGEVTAVRAGAVTVNGRDIPADFIVVATGARLAAPGKFVDDDNAAMAYLTEQAAAIRRAARVTIIGGGAVGLELAGEIRHLYADKTVTVVHSRDRLMSSMPTFKPKFYTKLAEKLEQHKINVILSTRVVRPEADSEAKAGDGEEGKVDTPASPPAYTEGTVTLRTDAGKELPETDLVIWTVGAAGYNTGCMREHFGAQLNEAGAILVDDHLRVQGSTNVFAMGDVAATGEPNMAVVNGHHVEYLQKALAEFAAGKGDTVAPYKRHTEAACLLTLGPQDGVLQFGPLGVKGGKFASKIKGQGMFLPQTWKEFGYPAPTLPKAL